MKTHHELAAQPFRDSKTLARQATTMRKLAGGLRTLVADQELTPSERLKVSEVRDFLEALAQRHSKASLLKKADEKARDIRVKQVTDLLKVRVTELFTVPDKIAFIALANRHLLTALGDFRSVSDVNYLLSYGMEESLRMAAWDLARSDPGKQTSIKWSADHAVEQLWSRFLEGKPRATQHYAPMIAQAEKLLGS